MGFNPAYWLAIAVAFAVGFMSVTDSAWRTVCLSGLIGFLAIFVLDLLRHLMDLEIQAPLKRREEPMAMRTRDFPDGTREYRIRVTAHGFIYSQTGTEWINGCLTSGVIRLEAKEKSGK